MNKEKQPYEPPKLTAVTFKVEQGFTASGGLQNYHVHNDAWGLGGLGIGSLSDYNIINDAWGEDGGRGSVSDYNVINDSWGI